MAWFVALRQRHMASLFVFKFRHSLEPSSRILEIRHFQYHCSINCSRVACKKIVKVETCFQLGDYAILVRVAFTVKAVVNACETKDLDRNFNSIEMKNQIKNCKLNIKKNRVEDFRA